jgi:hypothetical protein
MSKAAKRSETSELIYFEKPFCRGGDFGGDTLLYIMMEAGSPRPNGQEFQPYSRPSWQPGQKGWCAIALDGAFTDIACLAQY